MPPIATLSRRFAVSGVTIAVAAGALVAVTGATAQAATGSYTCATPLGDLVFPVDATAPGLPTEVLPGAAVPEGDVDLLVSVPATVAGALAGLGGLTGLTSSDFALDLAGTPVPVGDLAMGVPQPGDLGVLDVPLSGTTGAFTAPTEPGAYPVTMPSAFSLLATTASPALPEIDITCITDAPAVLLSLLVGDQEPGARAESTTVAKAKRSPIRKGQAARIVVRVSADDQTPTGRVVLKRGKKTVAHGTLNDRGRVVLKTKRLRIGKNRLVARYLGDEVTERSKDRVVVRVKKRRR